MLHRHRSSFGRPLITPALCAGASVFKRRDDSAAATDNLNRPLAARSADVRIKGAGFYHHEHAFLQCGSLEGNDPRPFGNSSSFGMAGVMGMVKPILSHDLTELCIEITDRQAGLHVEKAIPFGLDFSNSGHRRASLRLFPKLACSDPRRPVQRAPVLMGLSGLSVHTEPVNRPSSPGPRGSGLEGALLRRHVICRQHGGHH